MTFLPIVGRELRVAARRRATYWARLTTAVAAIIIGMVVYIFSQHKPPREVGQNLFQVLSILAIVYCFLAGVLSTADCLSEEKREGTLGLLFLTDLKGYDVVGGKLVATSLNAFYGLLALFPVLAIPLLMGGITSGEFWRMALVLADTFLFSLAIGMFISSISHYPRRAMTVTFLSVLFFAAVLPACIAWMPLFYKSPRTSDVAWLFVPFHTFSLAFDAEYVRAVKYFWWSAGIIHGLAWFCLALASVIVPRSWQDHPPGDKLRRWREFWHRWSFGDPADRRTFRKRLLDINAFFWLAGRARLKPAHVWTFLALMTGLWGWGCLKFGNDWFNDAVYFTTAIIINSALKFWVASVAGQRLGEDRKIGSLELLLSTPLTVPDILRGQLMALKRQFFGPVITVIVIECVFMLASFRANHGDMDHAALNTWVAGIILFAVDLITLSWVGMWVGLTAKNPNRATLFTLLRVVILPWLALVAVLVVTALASFTPLNYNPTWNFYLGLWFWLGIITDAVFGLNARWRLRGEFREVAVQRYAARSSLLRRWLGKPNQPAPNLPPVVAS